jgi:hypothetical protein
MGPVRTGAVRSYEEHVKNLRALSYQEGNPGKISIEAVATMLDVRDRTLEALMSYVEADVSWHRAEKRRERRLASAGRG